MNVNNFRGVGLQMIGCKVLARVIAKRVAWWAEHLGLLDENKAWFMKARSTTDFLLIMVRIEEIVLEEQIRRRNSAKLYFILMFHLSMIIKCAKLVREGKMWRRRWMDIGCSDSRCSLWLLKDGISNNFVSMPNEELEAFQFYYEAFKKTEKENNWE